jgi:uncharacterized LabA/DUF88 family protein
VLIDGQNFRYKLPNWTRLNIDYYKLGQILYGSDAASDRMRIIYIDLFTVEKSATEFPSVEAKNGFIHGLTSKGIEIQTCDVNNLPLKKNGKKITNMDRFVILNLEIVADDPEVSHVVMMSGDGDFYPHLKRALNNGKRVTVVSVRDSISPKFVNDPRIEVIYFDEIKKELISPTYLDEKEAGQFLLTNE